MSKTVLITGASSGIGQAAAKLFAEHGWKVIILARREEKLLALSEQLGKLTLVQPIVADIRDAATVEAAIENLPSAFQHIDVLVNNAGLALGLESADRANLDDWHCMIDTNVTALVDCTRIVLPRMKALNRGHIINIGSIAGSYAYPGGNVYGASKAFVKQFSHNLRADLLGSAIRVTNIEPGLTETEFALVRFKGDQERASTFYENLEPLRAEDIAESIWWVANQPAHVNINHIELMPVCQAWSALSVAKTKN